MDGSGLTLHDVGLNGHNTAGAMLISSTASYILYGVAVCQVIYYFHHFPKDLILLKIHVALVCIAETVNVFLMTAALWYYLIRRGADMSFEEFIFCNDWTLMAQSVPTEITCLLVEAFFISRMWRITDSKYIAWLTVWVLIRFSPSGRLMSSKTIPFLSGWGFNIAYAVGMYRYRCYPDFKANDPWLFSSYGSRIVSDGLIAGTMLYMLYKRRPDTVYEKDDAWTHKTRTLKMVNLLSVWAVSTGLLMWLSAIAFMVSYLVVPTTQVAPAVYLLRGRIPANTMLAVLNIRQHMRNMTHESIALTDEVMRRRLDQSTNTGTGFDTPRGISVTSHVTKKIDT
ncbi:hypothetical protein NLJ89_g5694 [Agrocybe chaxingu]|uniref:DUF6534 domain-containing protein n=1 Tax=Agrocybe chaxingu TaxID=84603 RepID=A0A9W8K0L1_9AGAR|nr:hypothetical protein NLJ89_g5694 [Agrocybe chaxingu]